MSNTKELLSASFLDSMKDLLGDGFQAYLDSFDQEYYQGIRINTSKISVEEFFRISPFALSPIPWTENGFYVDKEAQISKHPYYYAGLYYIQEPSAMVPASRIPVKPGDKILDLCAAPGGKSTELASRLKQSGVLVANDISNSRAKALLKNLELFGAGNIYVCSESPEKLQGLYPSFFDRILIDAPCSGEGMFRKDPAMLKSYAEHGPEFYSGIQKEILESAYQMLKPGGTILYSTCTFAEMENENNIRLFLQNHPDMHLLAMKSYEAFAPGLTKSAEDEEKHLNYCVRLFPHLLKGEGHFAALLEKEGCASDDPSFHSSSSSENDQKEEKEKKRRKGKQGRQGKEKAEDSNSAEIPKEWEAFVKETMKEALPDGILKMVGDSLYLIGDEKAAVSRVRFLRTGLYLGECKKNRFEPSQALAMFLKKEMVVSALDLKAEDERVIRYLKGETIELSIEEKVCGSWILICVDGYPLGWGKAVGGTIRNKYYSGWRMN